jgi:soluble lytic murein transglycosylase-like protein
VKLYVLFGIAVSTWGRDCLGLMRPNTDAPLVKVPGASMDRILIGTLTLVALTCPGTLVAGDSKKSIERQLEAAKRQRDSVQARRSSDDFFQSSWLNEEKVAEPAISAECDKLPAAELQALVSRMSLDGISPRLVHAVIEQESAGRPCAVSSKGAMGLMQLMPELARELNVIDAFDPEQNVRAGVRHLVQLTARYNGDVTKVLAAYNAGAARVDSTGGIPDIPETQTYVRSILAKLDRI